MSIRIGHKGAEVKKLQNQLSSLGYSIDADGVFGYTTLQAVRQFQMQMKLKADGIVGAGTMAKIQLALGTLKTPQTEHFKMAAFIDPADTEATKNGIPYLYYENLQVLMERLEAIQNKLGENALVIRSGYRSPRYNRRVGGAKHSQHLFAKAADIYVKDYALSAYELGSLIMSDETLISLFGGLGLGSVKNVHVDIRMVKKAGKPTIWWYGNKNWKDWGRAR
ncbi:MAG: peptidoglycan-binding protein [Eubacteriales bacterium]